MVFQEARQPRGQVIEHGHVEGAQFQQAHGGVLLEIPRQLVRLVEQIPRFTMEDPRERH
ncbi:MAG: hypothetical protein ACRYGL_01615 [Janthinobacterium lividum]